MFCLTLLELSQIYTGLSATTQHRMYLNMIILIPYQEVTCT